MIFNQRFGIELEYNSFSEKNEENKLPLGILEAADVLKDCLKKTVYVSTWHTTVGNDYWIIKPDSSCGFEICSPILKSSEDLKNVKKVIKNLRKKGIFLSDKRCSLHVHFELKDISNEYLSNLIISWARLELFFFLLLPNYRKQTNYAQMLSLSPLFFSKNSKNLNLTQETIVNFIKEYKFYSINLYHLKKSNRRTIEFRIMDSSACLNEEYAFYWLVLLNKFIFQSEGKNYFIDGILDSNFIGWLNFEDSLNLLDIKKDSKVFNFCKSRFYNYSLDSKDLTMSVFKNIFETYIDKARKYFENK